MPSPAASHPVHSDAPESAPDVTPSRGPPRRARWRLWLRILVVVLAIRFLLTLVVLAPYAEVRLSRILGAAVQVGGVAFAPIDGIVTLRNVAVRPAGEAAGPGTEPIVTAKRVALDVQWLPLLHRSLVLRELALDGARIDLERLRATGWTLDRVQQLDPGTELPPSWSFALGRVVLRDTTVALHPGEADAPPLEVAVREALVSTARRRASAFGRVPNLRVDALVGDGRVLVNGSSDIRDDGVAINARVRLKDVPVEPFAAYRPELLSASRVGGRVSARLAYQRDPGRRDRLTGQLRGRRLAVHVPALAEPAALAVRRLDAEIVGIDLRQRRVAIGTLTLRGADLAARPDLTAPLPLLDSLYAAPAPPPADPPPARRPETWGWSIAHLEAPAARVVDTGTGGERVLAASVSGDGIGPAAYWSPLRAAIGWEGGTATFDGTVRMTHGFTVAGRLTAQDMDAVAVARAMGPPLATLVQTGLVTADLDVELALGRDDGPPLDARGRIGVHGLWLAGENPDELAFGAHDLELRLARIMPGPGGDHAASVAIDLDSVAVASPYLKLTRTAQGWSTGAALEPAEPAEFSPQPEPPAITLSVADATVRDGRLIVRDETTTPPAALDFAGVRGSVRDFHGPASVGELLVEAREARFGALRLTGVRDGDRLTGELSVPDFALDATLPYFRRTGLPYAFTGGRGAAHAIYALAGDHWNADTMITLLEPTLGGDQDLLERALGMPPAAALAAVGERHGDILLRLHLASPLADPRSLTTSFAGAVHEALARPRWVALPDAPLRVAFAPGRPDPAPDMARQLAAIAQIQEARPDAVLEVRAVISRADRRWIAEQALAANPTDRPGGFRALLRAVGVRDQRTRIRDALTARGAGEAGELDAEDEAALDAMIATAPPVPADRLAGLAAGRAALVAKLLGERHGVAVARVVDADPAAPESAAPVVEARFLPIPGMALR